MQSPPILDSSTTEKLLTVLLPQVQVPMVDLISFVLGGITVAFVALVAKMGGDCMGAAHKLQEDPAELVNQFKTAEGSGRTMEAKCC
mmetsp:Transcript_18657/g.38967  ORF Transcript_18657/g.38967 Transcript_18657/m.38967 type:complete len:87 (-) Transcript_18657:55-315(-)